MTTVRRQLFLSWLTIFVLALTMSVARVSMSVIDDDNVYLAYSSLPASEDTSRLLNDYINVIAAEPNCELTAYRLSFRDRYARNYSGYLLVQNAIYSVISGFGGPALWSLLASTLATKFIFLFVTLSTLVAVAAKVQDKRLNMALAFGMLTVLAGEILTPWVRTVMIVDVGEPIEAAAKLLYSFFVPNHAHMLSGETPRSAALVLFAIALVLKWNDRPVLAALTIVAMGFVHQTYGGVGLLLMSVLFAISKPEALDLRSVRLTLVAAVLIYIWQEKFFGDREVASQWLLVVTVFAAAATAFTICRSSQYRRLVARMLDPLASEEQQLDALVCVLAAAIITGVCLIGGALEANPITGRYLWSDLATRIWSFVRYPAFVAAALWAMSHWPSLLRHGRAAIGTISVVLCLTALAQIDPKAPGVQAHHLAELSFGAPRSPVQDPMAEEDRVYAQLLSVAMGLRNAGAAHVALVEERPIRCTDWRADFERTRRQ